MTDRERALLLLRRIDRELLFATPLLQHETGFVRTLVLGVLRWRLRLDAVIASLAQRSLGQLDPIVIDVLRLGVYQLMFMDVAPYAAVNETVTLAGRHAKRARGFVNAVMRRATERDLHTIGKDDLAVRTAHPRWLLDRWIAQHGEERAAKIAAANQELSYPDVVVDEPPDVEYEPSPLVDGVVRLKGSSGDVKGYAMDEGSAVVASMAAAAGSDILDLAAAPGGKSLFMRRQGAHVVSNDVSIARLMRTNGPHVVSDGRRPPFRRRFQTVLLDAPCSATGTIRKNPEIKWRLREADIASFVPLQRELLASALTLARETCVYSTCSLEREENDDVIASVEGFEIVDPTPFVPPGARRWVENKVLRLTPESGSDGFTAVLLRRK